MPTYLGAQLASGCLSAPASPFPAAARCQGPWKDCPWTGGVGTDIGHCSLLGSVCPSHSPRLLLLLLPGLAGEGPPRLMPCLPEIRDGRAQGHGLLQSWFLQSFKL